MSKPRVLVGVTIDEDALKCLKEVADVETKNRLAQITPSLNWII